MTTNLFEHVDTLKTLNDDVPIAEKLGCVHAALQQHLPAVERVAVALYDARTDVLKTFSHSTDRINPLQHYQSRLADAASLQEILAHGQPRVIQDLTVFAQGKREHTQRIAAQGYRASYTMPMYHNGSFVGFVFFNSTAEGGFQEAELQLLDIFGHLVAVTVISELISIRTLVASVQATRHVTQYRDVETGAHVSRTAHYARMIAQHLAVTHKLSDEFIEHVYLFSPLHDIGKIGVPDSVLLKPGKLTIEEFEVMKTHARRGGEIIDIMLKDFALSSFEQVDILRNIVLYHHETMDGAGYPAGLKGTAIPLEARISAVADIFDALTSRRPYKHAWSNDEAFAALRGLIPLKLDSECVEALIQCRPKIEAIQARFRDVDPKMPERAPGSPM